MKVVCRFRVSVGKNLGCMSLKIPIYARVVVDDKFLKEYCHVYRWQKVEVLKTTESKHTKQPKKIYHHCRIVSSGRKYTFYDNELEFLNGQPCDTHTEQSEV